MRSGVLMSIALHAAVVLISVLGLPHIKRDNVIEEVPMVVELVSISTETNVPSQSETKAIKDPPEPTLPRPPDVKNQPLPSTPEPETIIAPMPKAKAKTKPEPKPTAKPKPRRKVKTKPPEKLAKVRPRRKPRPPDEFAAVLKNLAQEFKKKSLTKTVTKDDKVRPKKDNFEKQIAKVLTNRQVSDATSSRITMTERHAMVNTIRKAIRPCWNIQPGAKGAQDIIVVIRATLSPEGKVQQAWVTNRSVFQSDPFKLAAAETAQRAVLNRACQPFKLDPKRYDVWKDVTLSFNPSEMFGR